MKKYIYILSFGVITLLPSVLLTSCSKKSTNYDVYTNLKWIKNNTNGWNDTLKLDFTSSTETDITKYLTADTEKRSFSGHEFWTDPSAVDFHEEGQTDDNGLYISAYSSTDDNELHTGLLTSIDKFTQKYGFFSITMSMLSANFGWDSFYLQSKDAHEVDVLESVYNDDPGNLVGCNWYYGYNSGHANHVQKRIPYTNMNGDPIDLRVQKNDGEVTNWNQHTYSLLWTPTYYAWYIDDYLYYQTYVDVSQEPHYMIIMGNMAPNLNNWGYDGEKQFSDFEEGNGFYIKNLVVKQNDNFPV